MRRLAKGRLAAVAIAAQVLFWLVVPLGPFAAADILDDTGTGTASSPVEVPTTEVTQDPVSLPELPELPGDPIGAIGDTVDSLLNPGDEGDPGTQPDDGGSGNNETASSGGDKSTSGQATESGTSTQSSSGGSLQVAGPPDPDAPAQSDAVITGDTAGQTSSESGSYRSYRPAATRFVAFSGRTDPNYKRSPGGRSTEQIIKLLRGAKASPRVIARILAPFPVAGVATYSDDWGNPRFDPTFHLHEGVDIFADRGTPVIASSDGTVTRLTERASIGGISLRLTAADGTYFYYAHLDRFAPRLTEGMRVSEGDVLGFVGMSGNAEGGPAHLHFEIHPKGGAAVPPVPYLDRWMAEALYAARAFKPAPSGVRALLSRIPEGAVAASRLASQAVEGVGQISVTHVATWIPILAFPAVAWFRRRRRIRAAGDSPAVFQTA